MKAGNLCFFLTAGLAAPTLACDLCAIYSASQAQGEVGRGIFAGASEQFTHFGTVQVDGKEIPNEAGQYLDSSISQIFGGYNFSPRWGLQFNLPVIYRAFKRPDGQGGIEYGTEAGLGDVSLLGHLMAYSHQTVKSTVRFHLLAGVKFPTGSTTRISEEFEEVEDPVGPPSGIHGHDLTLGSGSFDGLVGGTAFARSGRCYLDGTVQYAIRSEGDYHYQFANDLTWSGGPGVFLFLRDRFTLSMQAAVSGEYKGLDTFQGAKAEDTGVTSVYLGPQISLTWASKLSAYLGADLPVSIDNTSLQTVPDYRIRAGLTWRF
jgi:hypothetical protein